MKRAVERPLKEVERPKPKPKSSEPREEPTSNIRDIIKQFNSRPQPKPQVYEPVRSAPVLHLISISLSPFITSNIQLGPALTLYTSCVECNLCFLHRPPKQFIKKSDPKQEALAKLKDVTPVSQHKVRLVRKC